MPSVEANYLTGEPVLEDCRMQLSEIPASEEAGYSRRPVDYLARP